MTLRPLHVLQQYLDQLPQSGRQAYERRRCPSSLAASSASSLRSQDSVHEFPKIRGWRRESISANSNMFLFVIVFLLPLHGPTLGFWV